MDTGAAYATLSGTEEMQMLYADRLDLQLLVNVDLISQLNKVYLDC